MGTILYLIDFRGIGNPRWPSRGATGKLHETQALDCPLTRGNSTSALDLPLDEFLKLFSE